MKKIISLILALAICLSLCACGQKAAETAPEATASTETQPPQTTVAAPANERITFDDLVLAEDKNVKISLVDFFVETMNFAEGPVDEKCATLKIENKTDQNLSTFVRAYLDNEELSVVGLSGGAVEAGRVSRYSATYDYGAYPNFTPLESLDKMYGLELTIELTFGYDTSEWTQYELHCSVADALSGVVAGAEALVNESYADVIQLMVNDFWFFNGGSDAAVNMLEFTEDSAVITQIVYDGNGPHVGSVSNFTYLMSDTDITLTLADGSELAIAYSVNDGMFTLEGEGYLTPAEVDADLQGYWGLRESSNVMGVNTEGEYIYYYENGIVTYEKASKALDGGLGEYYYFGPYEGVYTIDRNGLSTTAKNNWQFGFNIIDGKAVMVRCGAVCYPESGFKGEYGYSF